MASFSLPKPSELSTLQKAYLNQSFNTHQDLLFRAPFLLSDLSNSCSDLESHLVNLQKQITKLFVSWISRSFEAKNSISSLGLLLKNLGIVTSSHVSCLGKLEKFIGQELPVLAKNMRQIEIIRKYADTALRLEVLVGDVEDAVFSLRNFSTRNMFSAKEFEPKQKRLLQAVKVMNDIEEILVDLVRFQSSWVHLLESVDTRVDNSLAAVRPQILADHRALLASLGWPPKLLASKLNGGEVVGVPNPLVLMEQDKSKYYSESFLGLCALQHLQTRREDRRQNFVEQKKCGTRLWTIDELVFPIASRVEYHLSKWADQPELMFALVYKITENFIIGIDDVLQPLIDRARLVGVSAREAWVCAMVQMISGYLAKATFPDLAERYKEKHMRPEVTSSWLHLIDHIIAFDKKMQSLVSSESSFSMEWSNKHDGLSVLEIFRDRPDWLKIWAKIELKYAWEKLKSILKDENAWLICRSGGESEDLLLSTREDHKAPLVAESAVKLAWQLIERCQTWPDAGCRSQFISSTAAKFIWHFLNVLVSNCNKIEIPLDYPDDALIKICGAINAARYIESNLHKWSDDITFLEMTMSGKNVDVGVDNHGGSICFFTEEIKSLSELETNWLMEIIAVLLQHFETLSWEYLQNRRVFEHTGEDLTRIQSVMDITVSTDIIQALDTLRGLLHILKTNLNALDFVDLWRSVADGLDHYTCCSIIDSNILFSDDGLMQFEADMQVLLFVFQPYCARPEAFFPCITETLKLLKMSKEEADQLQSVAFSDVKNNLISCGVRHLSFDQVRRVLRNRKF